MKLNNRPYGYFTNTKGAHDGTFFRGAIIMTREEFATVDKFIKRCKLSPDPWHDRLLHDLWLGDSSLLARKSDGEIKKGSAMPTRNQIAKRIIEKWIRADSHYQYKQINYVIKIM